MRNRAEFAAGRSAWQPSLLLLILATLTLWACSSDKSSVDTVSFTVNPELLGDRFENTSDGFSLQAPVEWVAAPESVLDQIHEQMPTTADPKTSPEIIALYRNAGIGAHLAVGRYADGMDVEQCAAVVDMHATNLGSQFGNDRVKKDRFTYKDSPVDQLMVLGDDLVIIKLFVHGHAMYQLDYVVPRSGYESQLRAIESSIGSVSYGS